MLCRISQLFDRYLHPRAAGESELRQLRRRLAVQPEPTRTSRLELQLALRLRSLRCRMASALGNVTACSRCGRGHAPPHGRWEGGFCCGGETAELFSDHELGAMRLGGTRCADLRQPSRETAGCLFRGPAGCALRAQDRPNQCLSYRCQDLTRELHALGRLAAVERLQADLDATFGRFVEVRTSRIDNQLAGLETATGPR